jgi:hypothetical protein
MINDCQGRVIIVKPIDYLSQIPDVHLKMIPSGNLQSLSVAVEKHKDGLSEEFLDFANRCAKCSVTAIRSLGRGAFPQLSYSWDGYIPLDLICNRPEGYFSTIEFDEPFVQMIATYNMILEQKSLIGNIFNVSLQ